MVKIRYVGNFIKHFNKRIEPHPNLSQKFDERIKLFLVRAFSIAGDIRVVYYEKEGVVYFVDVGTHNQVY